MGARKAQPLGRSGRVRKINGHRGEISRVFHPDEGFTPDSAAQVLSQVIAVVDPNCRLIMTGGGFIKVDAHCQDWSNLSRLAALAERSASQILEKIPAKRGWDLCLGIDIADGIGQFFGQFATFIRKDAQNVTIIWKSYPVGEEARYLAGFGTVPGARAPRFMQTGLGKTCVFVCHDAQAFNHRNQANVGRNGLTARGAVVKEMTETFSRERPAVALNLVHWIEKLGNTRTFNTSYRTLYRDYNWHPKAYAAFGYSHTLSSSDLVEAINKMKWPDSPTTDVIVEWP